MKKERIDDIAPDSYFVHGMVKIRRSREEREREMCETHFVFENTILTAAISGASLKQCTFFLPFPD